MTEYDIHKIFEEQQSKDRVTALYADNGVLTVYYGDDTMEVWKLNWRGKLKRIKRRKYET
tara:strand:- start:670 stop:849 length:180 start_codon:yes stop_codon:yes gene_type:complete